jgi:hypothetical protein
MVHEFLRGSTARSVLALCLALTLGGCKYAGDRAMDFTDQYRLVVGAGTVGGVRFKSGGLLESGLMFGVKPKTGALGWRYGSPMFFDQSDGRMDADQAEVFRTTSVTDLDYADGSYRSAKESFALVPALLTWSDSTPRGFDWEVPEEGEDFEDRAWIWSRGGFRDTRYEQIHAFDVEFEAGLFVYLDSGFSLGEMVDFLLGFLLIDIARDDGRL